MIAQYGKRALALFLAIVLLISASPVQAFATENDGHDHPEETIVAPSEPTEAPNEEPAEAPSEEPVAPALSEAGQEVQDRVDEILMNYLGTTSATEEELETLVAEMDEITRMDLQFETLILEEDLEYMDLTEAEQQVLVANNVVYSNLCDVLMDYPVDYALYATHSLLEGAVTVSDSGSTSSNLSDGTVTITAKGGLLSKKTATVNIYNSTESKAQVSFDYSADKSSSFTIAGATAATSGSYSVLLDAGASVEVKITSNRGFSNLTATLKLSNFSLVAAASESEVTFDYDSAYGSITVGGNAVEDGAAVTIDGTAGAALVATAANGGRFLGWVDAEGKIISTAASYTLVPASEMTVKAVFVGTNSAPHFAVGAITSKTQSTGLLGLSKLTYYQVSQVYIIEGLNEAAAKAAGDSSNKALVLLNDATLPAGDYTIPAGVTLLIPFDGNNTMYTTAAVGYEVTADTYKQPTAYRTLTLADGAKLTVNGSVSLSGKHAYAQGSKDWGGAPVGPVGFLRMEGNSAITITDGGKLYTYGYITGSGSVTANSGATIYELFQIADFRGGTQSTDMDNGVFPISQYYIQNIEVPLTIYSGATEYAYTTVYMSSADFGSAVGFIAKSGAMFNLTSGYVTKRYDGTTDRLVIDSNGNFTVSSINMTVGTSSINSKNYELPINGNMSVNVHSGTITINQDVCMLPGSEIYVAEGAKCTIGSGCNMYVYDADEWGTYTSANNKTFVPVKYAPGKSYTRTDADLVDAKVVVNGTVDASKGYVYTTAGGADITGTGTVMAQPGAQTITHQLIQNTGYVEIPLTSAKLKNADGSIVGTDYTAGTYTNTNGVWVKACSHIFDEKTTKEPTCTETGLKTQTCKDTINCGLVNVDVEVPAKGHTEVIDAAVAPTCTVTGLTEGKHCSVCNVITVAQTVVDATGHTEAVLEAKAPTCTETGLTEGLHCSVCKEVFVAQNVVEANGHTNGAAATCTTAQVCTVCGVELVAALGHNYNAVVTEPTCTAAGYTTYTCSACGDTYVADEVAAKGHSYENVVTAPTCTEGGYTTYTCSVCGDSYVADETAATGHNWGWVTDKEATVLESGIKHEECSVCHIKRNENTEIPMLACEHTGTITGTEAKAETCTEAGNSAYWYCSACQNYYSDAAGQHEIEKDSWIISAKGHAYNAVVTEPTCTAAGYTTYTCGCGDTYVADEVAALGHSYVTDVTYPSGVVKGHADYTCSACGDSYRTEWLDAAAYNGMTIACIGDSITAAHGVNKDENDYVKLLADKLGMNYIRLGVSGTTLATDGSRTCNIDQLTEAKLKGADVVTIAMGINDFVAAKDGEYELGDINSTDTSTIYGAMKMWCERIEELKKTDSLSDTQFYFVTPVITSWKNGSVRNWDQSVANDNGYTLRDLCNAIIEVAALYDIAVIDLNLVSGLYYVDANDNNIDVFGGDGVHPGAEGHEMMADAIAKVMLQSNLRNDHEHEFGSWITTTWPSCLNGKQQQRVCSVCGEIEVGAKSAALGHDIVEHEGKAPTCQTTGWDAYVTCNRCAYTTEGEELPIDPEGHVWDEGEPYMNHSCNSASYMKYTCTLCKATEFVVVREQHFRIPIGEEIPATCTEDGMTSGWKCEKCDEFWIPQEVIPALGHDWNGNFPCQSETSACTRCDLHFDAKQDHLVVVDAAVAATCTTTGLTEGSHCEYCGEILVAQTEIPVADHNWIVADMEIPATCNTIGHKDGASYCLDCDYDADPIPMLEHEWEHRAAKGATYTAIGWNAHDYCRLCNAVKTGEQYESDPCEFCGENPEGYIEIPKLEMKRNATIDEFLTNLGYLEMMAEQYAMEHPGTDPLALVLNYLRTGIENYTSGSWAIMAGPEDKDFLKYVQEKEDEINSYPEANGMINVSGLKKIRGYSNTHGENNVYSNSKVTILDGHLFGTMDMTYHNKGSQNHADVGGWVGDLTDLLSTTDEYGVPANLTLDEKVEYIREKYLFKVNVAGSAGSFGYNDLYSDLDGYYFMNELITKGYQTGDLEKLMREYYQPGLTLKVRFSYLMNNRLDGLSTRQDLRAAVYNAYTSNKLISTLEGTRNFVASGSELAELRKAICYAFADEMCRVAGDYVEDLTNDRFTVFDTETKILAPGVSQQINYATNADGKQIVYYVATADVNRDDVGLWVNYYDRDPGTPENPQWKNSSVPNSAQNAQDRYGDPESPDYIENFNVIASTNAGAYDMSDTATPGGLMVMNGIEWHPQTNTAGFFATLNDGTAYMGTHDEYKSMMEAGLIQEAIGGFGEFVVMDGQVVGNPAYSDAPRTSVGITATGRVVLMCIDGRQAPFSSGASLQDVGYIMKEAGCVVAINLDGGGSTTFVARQPGSDELTVMNRPSDGYPRNVSTNLLIYSTAPSSTKFDHAVIESEYDYATVNTPVQMTAAGVSPAGNAVDVPEGATWAVSDEAWGEITEDGVFTGKRPGEVYVYLMLDGQVIGSKLMTMTNPDQLYFEKTKIDAIYGSGVELPLRARFEGKPIAINPNDVTITLSTPDAGVMDGFTFVAAESAFKQLYITAALSEDTAASIKVMLYQQGENNFDFDKATGGDRMLAWHRDVSNSKVEDGNIYNVIDPSKDMVTSYTFAMDMTTIPIPERLSELTYMLPGGTVEGTNAWTMLLSLAQRISNLSWVKATIDFDDRFVVDYSELNIINEYFQMKSLEFDEATNTLTVTMGWIKQSQVINEATANPLCLIKGLKLTPKDGVWADVTKIDAVTSGNISYEIYMRASGLYSFAQKPENQETFGIYPYRNEADTSDAGGYFADTYAEITDTFTLVNVLKEGWVNEDGGFAYYVEGERLTGVQEVDGIYYDFGEQGVNVGQTKYTGLFFDEQAQVFRYSYIGELADGWQSVGEDWYYFKNFEAVSGAQKIGGVKFNFEENGRLTSGVWANVFTGWRYYYGPNYYQRGWANIDGNMYYFREGLRVTGISETTSMENASLRRWYDFGEDGACQGLVTGIVEKDGTLYFATEGAVIERGLIKWEGEHYYVRYNGSLVVNNSYYAWLVDSTSDLPVGTYDFGPDGRLLGGNAEHLNGIVEKNGVLYYYENGKPKEKGLFQIDGIYYYARYNGSLVVDETYYAWLLDSSSELPVGNYEFGADGRMLNGIVDKDGVLYYYENGNRAHKGLFLYDGHYYDAESGGKLITDQKYYVWKLDSSAQLPKGTYEFGADGRMLQGIVDKSGVLYYYVDGKPTEMGLFYLDGYHYYAQYDGKLITNQKYYAWKLHSSSLLPVATYEFAEDGRILGSCADRGEIVNKNGVLYYYEDGKPTEKGLFMIDGYYYYSRFNGQLVTGDKYYAWKIDASCDLPVGTYEFDEGGRMLRGIVDKNGVLYYYENGSPKEMGLFMMDGEYYYSRFNGALVINEQYYAWKLDATADLPVGTYEFGADGRMLQGIIEKNGTKYFYENGKPVEKGLFVYEGEYYYTRFNGTLVCDEKYYAWKLDSTSELPVATYEFDADGKMIGASSTGEIVEKNGVYYYYENGRAVEKGLFFLNGHYYFAHVGGRLITNQSYYVFKGNDLLFEKHYTFNEFGQIIG